MATNSRVSSSEGTVWTNTVASTPAAWAAGRRSSTVKVLLIGVISGRSSQVCGRTPRSQTWWCASIRGIGSAIHPLWQTQPIRLVVRCTTRIHAAIAPGLTWHYGVLEHSVAVNADEEHHGHPHRS